MIQSYPWYIADWRESETRIKLSLAERGLYRELLDYCYLEGSFPADERQIKLLSSSDGHEFARAWKSVRSLFELVSKPDGDRFVHPKVNEVRVKLFAYHEQRKHAGSKSGQSRRQRTLNERSNGTATKHSTGAEPSPTPTPSPDPTPTPNAPLPAVVRPGRFAEILASWPRAANPDQAARAWLSCVDTPADEALAFAARDRYLASDEVSRGIVMDLARWIMEQKSAKWGGKWPPAQARVHPGKASTVDRALALVSQRLANGERPI